jgi:hypothetical protein
MNQLNETNVDPVFDQLTKTADRCKKALERISEKHFKLGHACLDISKTMNETLDLIDIKELEQSEEIEAMIKASEPVEANHQPVNINQPFGA